MMTAEYNTSSDIYTIKVLLADALHAVIAETLDVSIDTVHTGASLSSDLGMSAVSQKKLQQELAFIFDSDEIRISSDMSVERLLEQVTTIEMSRMSA